MSSASETRSPNLEVAGSAGAAGAKSGKWRWFEACFCTDPNKTRDPSAPFANIVRCDSQEQPQQQ